MLHCFIIITCRQFLEVRELAFFYWLPPFASDAFPEAQSCLNLHYPLKYLRVYPDLVIRLALPTHLALKAHFFFF